MLIKKFLNGQEDLTDALEIRRKVFIEEQNISEEIERDEYDKLSTHMVIYDNGEGVATGRLVYKNNEYTIGRVAVLKEHRNRKLGAVVVNELINKAFLYGVSEIHVHAQKSVQGFYERLGFRCYGEIYEEAGIEHISMLIRKNI